MAYLRGTREVTFSMDQPVNIPRRLTEYVREGRTLFVASAKGSYINVDPIGAEFVHLFEDGVAIRDALTTLKSRHGDSVDLMRILGDLLTQIETRGFYQHATLNDEENRTNLTLLARLTNRCNLRCSHCLVSAAPDWPSNNELDSKTWRSILTDYAQLAGERGFSRPRVTITGGEAIYRRDAFEIIAHSKALGIRTELFTNGVLIQNARIASRIASVTDEVQVSFDGATARIHDQIRGVGMFDRTLKAVRLLAEVGANFRFAIVVMPMNYDDLRENLPALVQSIGVPFSVRLSLAVQQGRADESVLFPSLEEGTRKIKLLLNEMVGKNVRNERPYHRNLKTTTCGYAREITINSDGLVYGCGPQVYPIGNLRAESFRDVADRTVGKSKGAEVDFVEGCRECDIRYVCGGICRLANMARTGSATVSACDRANKERNIRKLFGYSSDIVPLTVLQNSAASAPASHSSAGVRDLVPLSALTSPSDNDRRA